ncbi:Zinc finger MYND-type [Trinorchestia longiramus]|nr:Zinc finger MYND-type [Trinorchestia longiramus]
MFFKYSSPPVFSRSHIQAAVPPIRPPSSRDRVLPKKPMNPSSPGGRNYLMPPLSHSQYSRGSYVNNFVQTTQSVHDAKNLPNAIRNTGNPYDHNRSLPYSASYPPSYLQTGVQPDTQNVGLSHNSSLVSSSMHAPYAISSPVNTRPEKQCDPWLVTNLDGTNAGHQMYRTVLRPTMATSQASSSCQDSVLSAASRNEPCAHQRMKSFNQARETNFYDSRCGDRETQPMPPNGDQLPSHGVWRDLGSNLKEVSSNSCPELHPINLGVQGGTEVNNSSFAKSSTPHNLPVESPEKIPQHLQESSTSGSPLRNISAQSNTFPLGTSTATVQKSRGPKDLSKIPDLRPLANVADSRVRASETSGQHSVAKSTSSASTCRPSISSDITFKEGTSGQRDGTYFPVSSSAHGVPGRLATFPDPDLDMGAAAKKTHSTHFSKILQQFRYKLGQASSAQLNDNIVSPTSAADDNIVQAGKKMGDEELLNFINSLSEATENLNSPMGVQCATLDSMSMNSAKTRLLLQQRVREIRESLAKTCDSEPTETTAYNIDSIIGKDSSMPVSVIKDRSSGEKETCSTSFSTSSGNFVSNSFRKTSISEGDSSCIETSVAAKVFLLGNNTDKVETPIKEVSSNITDSKEVKFSRSGNDPSNLSISPTNDDFLMQESSAVSSGVQGKNTQCNSFESSDMLTTKSNSVASSQHTPKSYTSPITAHEKFESSTIRVSCHNTLTSNYKSSKSNSNSLKSVEVPIAERNSPSYGDTSTFGSTSSNACNSPKCVGGAAPVSTTPPLLVVENKEQERSSSAADPVVDEIKHTLVMPVYSNATSSTFSCVSLSKETTGASEKNASGVKYSVATIPSSLEGNARLEGGNLPTTEASVHILSNEPVKGNESGDNKMKQECHEAKKEKDECPLKDMNKKEVSEIELLREELERTRREVEELKMRQDKMLQGKLRSFTAYQLLEAENDVEDKNKKVFRANSDEKESNLTVCIPSNEKSLKSTDEAPKVSTFSDEPLEKSEKTVTEIHTTEKSSIGALGKLVQVASIGDKVDENFWDKRSKQINSMCEKKKKQLASEDKQSGLNVTGKLDNFVPDLVHCVPNLSKDSVLESNSEVDQNVKTFRADSTSTPITKGKMPKLKLLPSTYRTNYFKDSETEEPNSPIYISEQTSETEKGTGTEVKQNNEKNHEENLGVSLKERTNSSDDFSTQSYPNTSKRVEMFEKVTSRSRNYDLVGEMIKSALEYDSLESDTSSQGYPNAYNKSPKQSSPPCLPRPNCKSSLESFRQLNPDLMILPVMNNSTPSSNEIFPNSREECYSPASITLVHGDNATEIRKIPFKKRSRGSWEADLYQPEKPVERPRETSFSSCSSRGSDEHFPKKSVTMAESNEVDKRVVCVNNSFDSTIHKSKHPSPDLKHHTLSPREKNSHTLLTTSSMLDTSDQSQTSDRLPHEASNASQMENDRNWIPHVSLRPISSLTSDQGENLEGYATSYNSGSKTTHFDSFSRTGLVNTKSNDLRPTSEPKSSTEIMYSQMPRPSTEPIAYDRIVNNVPEKPYGQKYKVLKRPEEGSLTQHVDGSHSKNNRISHKVLQKRRSSGEIREKPIKISKTRPEGNRTDNREIQIQAHDKSSIESPTNVIAVTSTRASMPFNEHRSYPSVPAHPLVLKHPLPLQPRPVHPLRLTASYPASFSFQPPGSNLRFQPSNFSAPFRPGPALSHFSGLPGYGSFGLPGPSNSYGHTVNSPQGSSSTGYSPIANPSHPCLGQLSHMPTPQLSPMLPESFSPDTPCPRSRSMDHTSNAENRTTLFPSGGKAKVSSVSPSQPSLAPQYQNVLSGSSQINNTGPYDLSLQDVASHNMRSTQRSPGQQPRHHLNPMSARDHHFNRNVQSLARPDQKHQIQNEALPLQSHRAATSSLDFNEQQKLSIKTGSHPYSYLPHDNVSKEHWNPQWPSRLHYGDVRSNNSMGAYEQQCRRGITQSQISPSSAEKFGQTTPGGYVRPFIGTQDRRAVEGGGQNMEFVSGHFARPSASLHQPDADNKACSPGNKDPGDTTAFVSSRQCQDSSSEVSRDNKRQKNPVSYSGHWMKNTTPSSVSSPQDTTTSPRNRDAGVPKKNVCLECNAPELFRCPQCRKAGYCSEACRFSNWASHSSDCVKDSQAVTTSPKPRAATAS